MDERRDYVITMTMVQTDFTEFPWIRSDLIEEVQRYASRFGVSVGGTLPGDLSVEDTSLFVVTRICGFIAGFLAAQVTEFTFTLSIAEEADNG